MAMKTTKNHKNLVDSSTGDEDFDHESTKLGSEMTLYKSSWFKSWQYLELVGFQGDGITLYC